MTRLHNKLSEIGVPNELLRIAGGEHGGYWTAWNSRQLSMVENGIIGFINQQLAR